ncbi:MAG: hypothetical protein JW839_11975 [Candidatus Lokiarchaeota archaeon]|nr:hypothetical protein [Candidatus Lokiarchaeota archaeon]
MARKKRQAGGSGWTPPSALVTFLSTLLVAGGIYLGISGILHQHDPNLVPIGVDTNDLFVFLSFVLPGLGWLLMFGGVKSRYI